jgi:hypothetical protein
VTQRGGLEDVVRELRESALPTACLSSEDFSLASRSRDTLITVRDAIAKAGFTPIVVVYLRPQVSYCLSMYAEIVKNGNCKPFVTYLREVTAHGSFLWNNIVGPPYRYDVLLDRFAAVFGKEAIIVRRYRPSAPSNDLLRSFTRLLVDSQTALDVFTFPRERFNRSLSFPRVLRALGSGESVLDMRFAPLDVRETLALAATFERANRDVAQRYGVWVPPYEINDLLLAIPFRKSFARTVGLGRARRALRAMSGGGSDGDRFRARDVG